MIGRFKDELEAKRVNEIFKALTKQVEADTSNGTLTVGSPTERYGKDMLDLLSRLNVSTIGSQELEQFAYDVTLNVEGNEIVLKTEEFDISAYLKVMFANGARIEVYSAHDHPDTGRGRGQ